MRARSTSATTFRNQFFVLCLKAVWQFVDMFFWLLFFITADQAGGDTWRTKLELGQIEKTLLGKFKILSDEITCLLMPSSWAQDFVFSKEETFVFSCKLGQTSLKNKLATRFNWWHFYQEPPSHWKPCCLFHAMNFTVEDFKKSLQSTELWSFKAHLAPLHATDTAYTEEHPLHLVENNSISLWKDQAKREGRDDYDKN